MTGYLFHDLARTSCGYFNAGKILNDMIMFNMNRNYIHLNCINQINKQKTLMATVNIG